MVDETFAPDHVSVAETARRLGVTRQRILRMIHSGGIPAERAGRGYFIRLDEVERHLASPHPGGRRLTPAHAWGLLNLADDRPAPWLDRRTRHRLRGLLEGRSLSDLQTRLTDRAATVRLRVHPSQIADLRSDPRLVLTGASAASEMRLGLLAGEVIEAYVASVQLGAVTDHYYLRRTRDPNVVLRVVPPFDGQWAIERCAPRLAVAFDLLEDTDPRSKAIGEQILEGLR